MAGRLTIGEVARQAGVTATTLRYYEQIGLVPAPARLGGQRRYDVSVLARLEVIQLCKSAGFALDEIHCCSPMMRRDGRPVVRWPRPNSPRSTPGWSRWPGREPLSSGECAARVRQLTPARAAFTWHCPPERA